MTVYKLLIGILHRTSLQTHCTITITQHLTLISAFCTVNSIVDESCNTTDVTMSSTARLLMLLLTTLAYPGGVAGDVTDAELAGAVVGTFLGTLLVCALLATAGYWFCVSKRRQNDEPYKQQRDDEESPNTLSSECCVRSRVIQLINIRLL